MESINLQEPVGSHIRRDTTSFSDKTTVEGVLGQIRKTNISDQIAYFYVIDGACKLVGVLPLRRLLSAEPEQTVGEIMHRNVITICEDATLEEAYRIFGDQKYLSLPVVRGDGSFVGALDVTVLVGENLDFRSRQRFDDIFETIGIHSSYIRYLRPLSAFKHRFPWLIPTVISGIACAIMAALFEKTLAESIVIAFFLTFMLGLGESVSIQSLTITVRQLHIEKPTWSWYLKSISRELATALILGLCIGLLIATLVTLWKGSLVTGFVIGLSVALSLLTASFFGLTIPALLHHSRLDPKVSAGPLVLGLSDIFTLLFYLTLASLFL